MDVLGSIGTIQKCAQLAQSKGYKVFALQNDHKSVGSSCRSSATAKESYKKHGISSKCQTHGKGGDLAYQAYEITGKEKSAYQTWITITVEK